MHIIRTNVVIDDDLMRDALEASGAKTKREAIEEGLRSLVRAREQRRVLELKWVGNLDDMRVDKVRA